MKRHPKTRTLRFEQMEDRRMKSVSPVGVGAVQSIGTVVQGPQLPPRTIPVAQGSITLTNGTVFVKGTDGTNDTVTITTSNGQVVVTLANINIPQVARFSLASVQQLNVQTFGGDDYVDNQTAIPMYADGGAGNDVLLGGTGSDFLYGGAGAGNDYLDGRAGNDTLVAGTGTDELFGDDGNDYLYGASGGKDYMFGGNGNDQLYGEGNNSFLFGEAGNDVLINYGTGNKLYQDYGPTGAIVDQFENFDWFDRNLQDPTVRSMARVEFRDMLLDRTDMLNIYAAVAKDGVVSAAEFNDLQMIAGNQLWQPNAVHFLAQRVADGDPANAHYQGAALGNLHAGSSATQLNMLVGKWFEGTDLPAIGDTNGVSVSYKQVSGSLFGANGPTYFDVDQGNADDCYILSALGEAAQFSPSSIKNMFINNGDGTYTVMFYHNGNEAFVTVNSELPVNATGQANFAGWGYFMNGSTAVGDGYTNQFNVLWVALAEKAYAQLNESGWIGQDGTNSYTGIGVGIPGVAYTQITNQATTGFAISGPSVDTGTALSFLLESGRPVLLNSNSNPADIDKGFTVFHIYMVISYDVTTETFLVVNPHNLTTNGGDGAYIQNLTWEQFDDNFVYATYSPD